MSGKKVLYFIFGYQKDQGMHPGLLQSMFKMFLEPRLEKLKTFQAISFNSEKTPLDGCGPVSYSIWYSLITESINDDSKAILQNNKVELVPQNI